MCLGHRRHLAKYRCLQSPTCRVQLTFSPIISIARHSGEQEFLMLSSCRNSARRRPDPAHVPPLPGRGERAALFISPGDFYRDRANSPPAGTPVYAQQRAQVSARAATVTRQGATAERDFCWSNLRNGISAPRNTLYEIRQEVRSPKRGIFLRFDYMLQNKTEEAYVNART